MSSEHDDIPDDFYKQATEVLGPEFWQEIGDMLPVTGPRIDVYYTSSTVYVLVELPALQKADQISMRVDGQTLVIEGELPRPYPVTDNRIIRKERFFGRFVRTLPLPQPVESKGIHAHYRQGLLTVELPIKPAAQAERIPLQF